MAFNPDTCEHIRHGDKKGQSDYLLSTKNIKASYKTLVRPQLEYAATVWDPSTKTSINRV